MNEILKTLLYSDLGNDWNNVAMLLFRCLLAWELFRVHGLKKFNTADGAKERIPNPLHLPEKINAGVAIAADTIVPFLLALGCLTRVVVLPTIGVTAIGYFVVHRKDSLEVRDVPYMYTLSLLLVLALGAGTYSIDNMLLP